MSLILKGSPSGTVYREASEADVTSSTKHTVYARIVASDNVSTPFIFLADMDLDASPRGFYLRQDSPTLMTLGWTTANGNNEHQFTVASGIDYGVMAEYDRVAETLTYYIDGSTPVATIASVGAPVDITKFCIRGVTSSVTGENVTIGDLAVWTNGGPDAAAMAVIDNDEYLGYVFKDSGCTNRYIFVGDTGTKATPKFTNSMRAYEFFSIERGPTGSDVECNTGPFMPAPAVVKTQIGSPNITYWDYHDVMINKAHGSNIVMRTADGTEDFDAIIAAGHYDTETGRYTSLPERYPGMGSWIKSTIELTQISWGSRNNPELFSGTMVVTWEGNGVLEVNGDATNITNVNSNRIEAEGIDEVSLMSIPDGGYISNIQIYQKSLDPIVAQGKLFTPLALEYYGRYDTIRMMDIGNTNTYYYTDYAGTKQINEQWRSGAPLEVQIQMAIEAGTNLWLNICPLVGSGVTDLDSKGGYSYFNALGNAAYNTFDPSLVYDFFVELIADLDKKGWAEDKDIKLEVGNELWNSGLPFGRLTNFCYGFGDALRDNEGASGSFLVGAGFIATMFMDQFKRAIAASSRPNQSWTPILGVQTGYTALTDYALRGVTHYQNTRTSTFNIEDFVISTTGYNDVGDLDYKADDDKLGQTYATSAEYYTAMEDMALNNTDELKIILFNGHIDYIVNNVYNRLALHKGYAADVGITNPIQEYEGSSHNTVYDSEWEDNENLGNFLKAYNFQECGAAAQRLQIELFAINNPGGAISNFQLLGTQSAQYGAWMEATSWSELSTSSVGAVWEEYIHPDTVDLDGIWTAYQARLDSDFSFEVIDIDENNIRSTHQVITTSTNDVVRSTGSIFSSANFDSINFEGAEFFYMSVNGGTFYNPVLDNSNFTGFFEITGGSSATVTMYLRDVVNDEWYEFDVVSQGPGLGFTINHVMNVAPSSSVNIEGDIYGTNGLTLTGTDLTFSNNDSDFTASISLVSGTTKYRRTVTSNADNDQLDTFTITINDGTTDYVGSVDVITNSDTNVDAVDIPDLNVTTQIMSDGSRSTNPNAPMTVVGVPGGSGNRNIRSYHDVIKFVKRSKTKVLTVTNITSVTNGVANIEFTGKYISATPSGTETMTMDITLEDNEENSITFNYNIDQ